MSNRFFALYPNFLNKHLSAIYILVFRQRSQQLRTHALLSSITSLALTSIFNLQQRPRIPNCTVRYAHLCVSLKHRRTRRSYSSSSMDIHAARKIDTHPRDKIRRSNARFCARFIRSLTPRGSRTHVYLPPIIIQARHGRG